MMRSRSAVFAATLAVFAACTDHSPAPTGFNVSASRSGLPFSEGLVSPVWQGTAAARVAQANFAPYSAGRAYSLVGVAQYLAVQQADAAVGSSGRSQVEAERGAVAGASAAVLTYLFPTAAQTFEDMVTAQANAGPGDPHPW